MITSIPIPRTESTSTNKLFRKTKIPRRTLLFSITVFFFTPFKFILFPKTKLTPIFIFRPFFSKVRISKLTFSHGSKSHGKFFIFSLRLFPFIFSTTNRDTKKTPQITISTKLIFIFFFLSISFKFIQLLMFFS